MLIAASNCFVIECCHSILGAPFWECIHVAHEPQPSQAVIRCYAYFMIQNFINGQNAGVRCCID